MLKTHGWVMVALALGAVGCGQGSADAAPPTGTAAAPAAPAPPAAKPLTQAEIEALIKDLDKEANRDAAQRKLNAAGAVILGPLERAVDAQLKQRKSKDPGDRIAAFRMLKVYVEILGVIGKPAVPMLRKIHQNDKDLPDACWALERQGEKCKK